jgi:hypothetical protein
MVVASSTVVIIAVFADDVSGHPSSQMPNSFRFGFFMVDSHPGQYIQGIFIHEEVDGTVGETMQHGRHVAPPQRSDPAPFNDFGYTAIDRHTKFGPIGLGGDHRMDLKQDR